MSDGETTERGPLPSSREAVSVGTLSPNSFESVRTTCLLVLTVLACGAALAWLRPVVVPFLVALALYYLLSPMSEWFVRRLGVPDWLGIIGAAVVGLIVVAATAALVWVCVAEMTRDADMYASRLAELSSDPAFARLIQSAGLEHDPETGRVVLISTDRARRLVRAGVEWLEGFLADAFLVLAFLPFMLLGGSPVAVRAGGLPGEVAVRVRRYLVEMFAFSVLTGVLVGGILALLGVRFWLSFGFLAFVLNFIPTLGSIAATILPVPVVLLDPDMAGGAKLLAILLPALVQVVVGNIIQPRFQSRTQGVHPVATILALIVFGMLWGPVGTVLAVPLAAVLKITFERIPGGGPFAALLAGRLHGSEEPLGSAETA